MTRERNIFIAKRNIVDYIYRSAKLEGINVTFPAIQAIYDGIGSNNVKIEDIVKINNLKCVWNYVLDILDTSTDFYYLCRLNMIIGVSDAYTEPARFGNMTLKLPGRNGDFQRQTSMIYGKIWRISGYRKYN